MHADSIPCPDCRTGSVVCNRCGGRGEPPRDGKRVTYYEKALNRCDKCLGAGSLPCATCGGIQEVPADKRLLRAL